MKKKKIISYVIGTALLSIGIYMSIVLKNPHFYTPFSIGLLLIVLNIYNALATEPIFHQWSIKKYFAFSVLLLVASVISDKIGLSLKYWDYPYYSKFLDKTIKILFEYALPLVYFMIVLLIGKILISKLKINSILSFFLSLLVFVPLSLIFTEYINSFSNSWVISFSKIIWFSIGAWLMALIPLVIYKFTEKFF